MYFKIMFQVECKGGDYTEVVPPVPISNTEVKQLKADLPPTLIIEFFGDDYTKLVPPVPISNTEVKQLKADDSALARKQVVVTKGFNLKLMWGVKQCISAKVGSPLTNFSDDFSITMIKSEAASPVVVGISKIIEKIGDGVNCHLCTQTESRFNDRFFS